MQPGQLLCNRYRVEKALAPGGFGETFLAVDTHLPSKPQVVVKLLKPIDPSPATLQIAQRLFNTEAETLERLGNDNDRIPSLYAYFELKGEFYLVQEYIKGNTLTDELHGQLSESDTLDILKEILTGLKTVHPGVIHRDLKPDNIIRRGVDRKLVLIDFGAVKQVRAATVTTPNPVISRTVSIGTNGYTPNEQWSGAPKLASDIYAVGAIAIQCLTGSAPHLLFDEDSLKLEWQHLRQVNRALAQVLNKMVVPDYRQRYANATEALQAIESLISPSAPPQIPSPPIPIPTPVIPTVPTKPLVLYPPLPKTIQQPANKQMKTPSREIGRRDFFKWLIFGGVGLVSAWVLNRVFNNSSSLPTANIISSSGIPPKSTKIQFTSIKLDSKGEIVDKPAGNTEIFTEDLGNGIRLTMVKIPAGKFLMGQTEAEKQELIELVQRGDYIDKLPQHQVNIPEFYLGQTLITQSQWVAIHGDNPSYFKGKNTLPVFKENDKLPVESVSWLDSIDFCEKLSQKTGRTYRLPSEAEWEYTCRAGTTTPFAFGETITSAVANYAYGGAAKDEYREGRTTPVGSFPPNLFGLYDLHGNVWEWCLDEWIDNYNLVPTDGGAIGNIISRDGNKKRLLRGGSWGNYAFYSRSAYRQFNTASSRGYAIGFRVVCLPSSIS
jgi:eukaryotic-like serine/threonine-protein kinase